MLPITFKSRYVAGLATAVLVLVLAGCNNETPDPYSRIEVDSSLTKDPPVASQINVSLLSEKSGSGNVLLEATMPREKVRRDVLAFNLGDSNKIVLHDDGQNGDRTAGDGIFSTVLNMRQEDLATFMDEQLANGRRMLDSRKPVFEFVGRLGRPVDRQLLERTFGADQLKIGAANLLKTGSGISLIDIFKVTRNIAIGPNFKSRSLVVTDPGVINDPARTFNPCTGAGTAGGAWTFGKLMKEMANTPLTGVSPEKFMLDWLNTWTVNNTVNGDVVPARPAISSIINTWRNLCGGPTATLDVNKAPFKLLAIVNRFDLHTGGGAYGGGNAGEGRFVFALTDLGCQPLGPPNFLVIFEYGVNKTSCSSIHAYAQQWVDLESLTPGTAAYNNALQAITDQFTLAGTNPGKPNKSSLDQLRTNDLRLGEPFWELREFNIQSGSPHELFNVTVKREPNSFYNVKDGSAASVAFGDFVNGHQAAVIADNQDLPDNLVVSGSPKPFIAGHGQTPNATTFHWDANPNPGAGHIVSDSARMHISLNTCSGCHGGETNNGTFTNIGWANGFVQLSPFLTGQRQPAGSPPQFVNSFWIVLDRANRTIAGDTIRWSFNDLEIRGNKLLQFVGTSCPPRIPREVLFEPRLLFDIAQKLTFRPLTMTD